LNVNTNRKLNGPYIRNVINSFAKSGRDVMKDTLLPSTSSLVYDKYNKLNEIKDFKYTFKQLKDKLTTPKYYDDKSLDNIEESFKSEHYSFSKDVKDVTDNNIKYFEKTNINLKVVKADLISSDVVKSVKHAFLNSNNILIKSLGIISANANLLVKFQNNVQVNFYTNVTANTGTILQLIADSNNSFAEFSRQKLSVLKSDNTENRIESLIRVEKMFSLEEIGHVVKKSLKKLGIDEDEIEDLIKLALKKPAFGLLNLLTTITVDKNKSNLFNDVISVPKNINNYIAMLLNSFKDSDDPLIKFLGKKFAPEKRDTKIIYRDNYNKESAKFDTYSKRAITHVIPSLLSQILNKLQNKNGGDELIYDYDNGGFTTQNAVEKLESKDTKKIQIRINNLDDANKKRKSVRNLLSYQDRFNKVNTVDYKKREYNENTNNINNIGNAPRNILTKSILKIDNAVLNIENPDSKLSKVISKTLGFVDSLFDSTTGMPSVENIKRAIIVPIKKKFGDYITSVKTYVKETYQIAVNSIVTAFKKPDNNQSVRFNEKLKKFLTEKIIIPLGTKLNDIKTNLLLKIKEKSRIVVKSIKKRIEAKKGSAYISNANIKNEKTIDIDLTNDPYSFNFVKFNMLTIDKELLPSNNIIETISNKIYDLMHIIDSYIKKYNKIEKLENRLKIPTYGWLEATIKYSTLLKMFVKDVIKSIEPMTILFKGFQTLKRMALNILGNITDAFVGVFKEATKFVRNIISIFTEKIPAALKFIDRFTGTISTLLKSKLSKIPTIAVGAIVSTTTVIIHKVNSILIDGVGSAIQFVGKAIRSVLLTARLLGNSLNKLMTQGKYYIKQVLRIGSRILGNVSSGRDPFINRLEYANIIKGHLDYVVKNVTAEIVEKDSRHEDEKKDDEKDIAKVQATANKITGTISSRIENRSNIVNNLVQKLLTKPINILKGIFYNVIGFIMGGTITSGIANVASKAWHTVGNSKIGKFLGLDKANKINVKKVYIDGGSLDDGDSGLINSITNGSKNSKKSKSIFKKIGGFLSKHKKEAAIMGTAAVASGILYKTNKDDENKENNVDNTETELKESPSDQAESTVQTESSAKPISTTLNRTTVQPNQISDVNNNDTAKAEIIIKNNFNDNSVDSNIEKLSYTNATPNSTKTFKNVDTSTDKLKRIYKENIDSEIHNKSLLYNRLKKSDKEIMLAQEGIQGIYRKTEDPSEYHKLNAERFNYKGMLNDFQKGFMQGGIIFGVINVLAKNIQLSKFRSLIKDKQTLIDAEMVVRRNLTGRDVFNGSSYGEDDYNDDYDNPGGGSPGGGMLPGGKIDWPSGNMRLGEKIVRYALAFLPQGKINYSQPLRDKIDKQGDRADCSSFVRHVYKVTTGINPGNTSREQDDAGTKVSRVEDLREGDILWKSGHVGLYAGANNYIDVGGPTNGKNDPKFKNIVKFNYFTMGRRVIDPDQMVDNTLNDPNTALTGLTSAGLPASEVNNVDPNAALKNNAQNADEDMGDPAILDFKNTNNTKLKPIPSSLITTENDNNMSSMLTRISNASPVKNITEGKIQDMSLEKLTNQQRQDTTLYGREGTIYKLQSEIVNLLKNIDVNIETILKLEDHLILHLQQVEGL